MTCNIIYFTCEPTLEIMFLFPQHILYKELFLLLVNINPKPFYVHCFFELLARRRKRAKRGEGGGGGGEEE